MLDYSSIGDQHILRYEAISGKIGRDLKNACCRLLLTRSGGNLSGSEPKLADIYSDASLERIRSPRLDSRDRWRWCRLRAEPGWRLYCGQCHGFRRLWWRSCPS